MPDEPQDAIPSVRNPNRAPTANFATAVQLFASKRLLLGDSHQIDDMALVPCGAACSHRLASISCPFFRTPCLVGCTVKQILAGEGNDYQEAEFFVVSQIGQYLIGEEVVLNLANPRMQWLRVIKNKLGELVQADDGVTGSLFDVQSAFEFTEEDLERISREPGEPVGDDAAAGGDPNGATGAPRGDSTAEPGDGGPEA